MEGGGGLEVGICWDELDDFGRGGLMGEWGRIGRGTRWLG